MVSRNHNTTLSPFLLADTGSSTHFRLRDFHAGFRLPSEDSVRFYLKELDGNAHPRVLPRVHIALNIEEPRGNVLPFPSPLGAEKEKPTSGLLKMEMGAWESEKSEE